MEIILNNDTYKFVDFEQPYSETQGNWGVFKNGEKLPEDLYFIDEDAMQIELYDGSGEVLEKEKVQLPLDSPQFVEKRQQFEAENAEWEAFYQKFESEDLDEGPSAYLRYRHKVSGEVKLNLPHPEIDAELRRSATKWESDLEHRTRWLKMHFS